MTDDGDAAWRSAWEFVIAPIALISLGIGIFTVSDSWVVRILVALVASFAVTIVWLLRERSAAAKKVTRLEDELLAASTAADSLNVMTAIEQGSFALVYYMQQDPRADVDHEITDMSEVYVLQRDDATFHYSYAGRRVTEGVSEALVIKLAGDSKVDAASLGAEARNNATGQPLVVSIVVDEPYFKVLRIEFGEPIAQGEAFDVALSLRWKNAFPRALEQDYLFSASTAFFIQGVRRLRCELNADVSIVDSYLLEMRSAHLEPAGVSLKLEQKGGRYLLRWSVDQPRNLFLLRFRKGGTP